MKLSRTVAYALSATIQLAGRITSDPTPCSKLAAEGEMPERFLLQVLRSLVTHGVLKSTRGVEGGYMLARPAEEITLLEIVEAIDGPVAADLSTLDRLAPSSREQMDECFMGIAGAIRQRMAAVRLSDLLPAERNGHPVESGPMFERESASRVKPETEPHATAQL